MPASTGSSSSEHGSVARKGPRLPHKPPLGRLARLAQRDQRFQQLGHAIRRRGGEGSGHLGGTRLAGPVRFASTARSTGWIAGDDLLSHLPGYEITTYLQNGGTIEHAQQIADHELPRTTKLYDRTSDAISLDEIERILI